MPSPRPDSFDSTRAALHALAEHVLGAAALPRRRAHRPACRRRAGSVRRSSATASEFGSKASNWCTSVPARRRASASRRSARRHSSSAFRSARPHRCTSPRPRVCPTHRSRSTGAAARMLADWYAFGAGLLDELRATYGSRMPSPAAIWPEHFDLACEIGDDDAGDPRQLRRLPGRRPISQPYLYVEPVGRGPPERPARDSSLRGGAHRTTS